jgi:hypothetical protein
MAPEFVGYVGIPDFHDGTIKSVRREVDQVWVVIRGATGREYTVAFSGVESLNSASPEGMTIYSISEMRAADPLRLFAFANWDDNPTVFLEVVAKDFSVT